jgi:hypothetical protein
MFLQEYIEELASGILIIKNSKVYLTGFTSPERLNDYYYDNIQCFFSKGLYDVEPLDFSRIQDNAIFIVDDKDNNIKYQYQYKLLKKDTIKYKKDGKDTTIVVHIRKCNYTHKYNYKDIDISIIFDTKEELLKYFKDRFNSDLKINESIDVVSEP